MNKEEVLAGLGFSANEAKVWLALHEIGPATAHEIRKQTKLHRANIYDALERLNRKGLVSHILKEGRRYFEASSPENLLTLVREKELAVQRILPELALARKFARQPNGAAVYEGVKAFQELLRGLLRHGEQIMVYGIPKIAPEYMKYFIPHFHNERIAKKIVMRHIYNHNAQARIAYLNSLPLTAARWLPSKYDSQVSTVICGDEIILTLWEEPISSVQIRNRTIADSYKRYFELLWADARR